MKKLLIDALGDTIYYGSLSKDNITISKDAKEISENNFIQVMISWLESKSHGMEDPVIIQNKKGETWRILISKDSDIDSHYNNFIKNMDSTSVAMKNIEEIKKNISNNRK